MEGCISMIEMEKPRVECVERSEDGTYARFEVEPLERGYGITLGNSLRRVLLSSLPGSAAISVKIDGVLHEFCTIPGVKEDVTEIILNIKKLITVVYSDVPKTVYIDATGAGEVKAGESSTKTFISQHLTTTQSFIWKLLLLMAEAMFLPKRIKRICRA